MKSNVEEVDAGLKKFKRRNDMGRESEGREVVVVGGWTGAVGAKSRQTVNKHTPCLRFRKARQISVS